MRNKIDFTLAPDALFLNPWQDPGFELLYEPAFLWRATRAAQINGFAASAHSEINDKIDRLLRATSKSKAFSKPIEVQSVPVLLHNASFRKAFVMVQEKLMLSGAAGSRAINNYRWEHQGTDFDADAGIAAFFEACRNANAGHVFPVISADLEPDIDIAISCRNTFNFYHFVTESLSQLTALDGMNFQGNIYFHFPNPEGRQREFAKDFVEALFPEFAGRVFFERVPKEYDRVVSVYEFVGGYHQAPLEAHLGMEDMFPADLKSQDVEASGVSRAVLSANAVSTNLIALRDRALAAIEGHDFSHLPRRFYVGRDDTASRARHMENEELLFENLSLFDFEYVAFENLSPLEQIALMARAEMMISYHGAGFTNMLWANPEAYVIEIGTLQTAQHRWSDFWPLAHASQCNYINFFADFRTENPLLEPNFAKDGIVPVSLSERAVAQIMAFVVTVLGQPPVLRSLPTVLRLTQEVFQVGAIDQALALLEAHKEMMARSAELSLLKADCHKELDEPKSELVALDLAYKADPKRWQTLVRIIWCANRCERPQVIRWALSRLKLDFPERHDAFVSNHQWVRYVA